MYVPEVENNQTIFVYINTGRNKDLTNTSWNVYELPNKAVVLFAAYAEIFPAAEVMLHASDDSIIYARRIGLIGAHHYAQRWYLFWNCISQFEPTYAGRNAISDTLVELGSDVPALRDRETFRTKMSISNNRYLSLALRYFFLAPFDNYKPSERREDYMFVSKLTQKRTITLESDELQAVKSIKATVISQNPEMDKFYRDLPEFLKNWQPEYK